MTVDIPPPADLLLRRARTPGSDVEVDISLADGRIHAIVPSGIVRPPTFADVVDLDGRFVVPGLWDQHVHFTQWALTSSRLDVSAAASAAEVADCVRARLRLGAGVSTVPGAATTPLIGFGFRDGLWSDHPSAALLDAAAGDTPVVLVCGDLHSCWLNTAALTLFGYRGHESGILREDASFAVITALADIPAAVSDALAADAAQAAAARGVVGIVDLEMAENDTVWVRRMSAGQHGLRVSFGIYSEHLDRAIERGYRTGDVIAATGGLLTVGPFKVIIDGSLNTRTAYCFDPYPGLAGHEHEFGMLTVAPDALLSLLERATRAGLLPAVHAIGDDANRLALDAFRALGTGGRIEHAQLLAQGDLARFVDLGVIASVQPEHAVDDRDVADVHWAGRTDRAFPLESLLSAGATLMLGSDAPVAPLDPWITIAAAVSRTRGAVPPWHPEQRIPAEAALAASTNGVTAIGVGQPADLAVVEHDPFRSDAADLRSMPVAATYLAGRPTHLTL